MSRPKVNRDHVRQLHAHGFSHTAIAAAFDVSLGHIDEILRPSRQPGIQAKGTDPCATCGRPIYIGLHPHCRVLEVAV